MNKYIRHLMFALALPVAALAQTSKPAAMPPAPTQAEVDALQKQVAQLQEALKQANAIEVQLQKQRNDAEDQVTIARAQAALAQSQADMQVKPVPKP